ncbi:TPR domain protein, putative [Rhodospirillum centenum SW]|uniref:TPR domain protein, putative n=2 Tax=Rhodospirillum centenum TaxID=34018 RepID=B6IWG3_RHOCS|nr:TPR domain protein, putative [Rhodospirillum centenum SW]
MMRCCNLPPAGRRPAGSLLLLVSGLALLCAPAAADPVRDRASCLARAEAAPDFALEEARLWQRQGGGNDALLCQAVALLLRADWRPAAELFERVIPALTGDGAAVRANLWGRTALAWANAKEPERAAKALDRALDLAPRDVELRLDRAVLAAGQERFWDALADLDAVLTAAPRRVDAHVLRAQVNRALGQDSDAARDVDRALALDPSAPQALLLRGSLRAERGDREGARADWMQVGRIAGQGSFAQAAAANLEALDALEAQERKEGARR